MPIGFRRDLDRHIPAAKRRKFGYAWGWEGLIRRDANLTGPPEHGRPWYGEGAKREVRWLRKTLQALTSTNPDRPRGVMFDRHVRACFRRVMNSERPLPYAKWIRAKEYLEQRTRERAAYLERGVPWPPKWVPPVGQRAKPAAPSSPPAPTPGRAPLRGLHAADRQPAALAMRITVGAKGPSLAIAMGKRPR